MKEKGRQQWSRYLAGRSGENHEKPLWEEQVSILLIKCALQGGILTSCHSYRFPFLRGFVVTSYFAKAGFGSEWDTLYKWIIHKEWLTL